MISSLFSFVESQLVYMSITVLAVAYIVDPYIG